MLVSPATVIILSQSKWVGVCVCVSCVRSSDMEQHAVIKFYFKLRKTAMEMYEDLKNMYGDDSELCTSHPIARAF